METNEILDRVTTLKHEKAERVLEADRLSRLRNLNRHFGRMDARISTNILSLVYSYAKEFKLNVPASTREGADAFFEFFYYNDWDDLAAVDIKMAGDIIASILSPVIKYDSKSFTFYYAEDKSVTEKFLELTEAYMALPWWKRFWVYMRKENPVMDDVWPKHIDKKKAI